MFDNLTPLLWAHFVAALLALALGTVQLFAPKGTPGHARAGRLYALAMLFVNVGALATYRMTGTVNIFHILAIVSLGSLLHGLWSIRRYARTGDPGRLRAHRMDMAYSYLGLVMAGVSQFIVNPRFGLDWIAGPRDYWLVMAGLNAVMYGLGSWWILATVGRRAPA